MLNLYTPIVIKAVAEEKFSDGEKMSILYHNLFDYPLTFAELIKWQSGKGVAGATNITSKDGFYFLEGRGSLVYQRFLRKRVSLKKMEIASNATKLLKIIPTVKMVAVTGSLAMGNSTSESDIDLLIVTRNGFLWTTRLLVYIVLCTMRHALRRPFEKEQKDKLCLNMWLDENDLVFRDRNLYTAHEIAQIVPLVNKDKTYEKFLSKNKWILKYWPNAAKVQSKNFLSTMYYAPTTLLESVSFWLQHQYMKSKMTREVATATRAFFHPQDWGKIVLSRLNF